MIGRAICLCVILVAGLSVLWAAEPTDGRADDRAPAGPPARPVGVVVVELFTSQGCSSCPPAEKVLADLSRSAERDGRRIFTLAFHVDYWNRLGWADPFSDAAYSRRQEQYAKALGLDDLYTPQMVVNGSKQFVGSDRPAADRAIADALATRPALAVTVNVRKTSHDGYTVRAIVPGAETNDVVNLAVIEEGLSTDVKTGENGGRRLEEPSVVRWFKTVPASEAGDIAIPALPGVRADHASVLAYAQRPGNGPILGAAAASLP